MRSEKRKRPRTRKKLVPSGTDLDALAARVTYVGSPEHKDTPSFAGPPRPRGDVSICPREYRDEKLITRWLRAAICDGSTGAPWEGDFPRYVWHKEKGTVFEARHVNRGDGSYKGYPLNDDEWPPHLLEGP